MLNHILPPTTPITASTQASTIITQPHPVQSTLYQLPAWHQEPLVEAGAAPPANRIMAADPTCLMLLLPHYIPVIMLRTTCIKTIIKWRPAAVKIYPQVLQPPRLIKDLSRVLRGWIGTGQPGSALIHPVIIYSSQKYCSLIKSITY